MSGSPGQCAALSQCPNLLRLGSESGAGFLHHRQGSLRQAPVAERPVALPPENQGSRFDAQRAGVPVRTRSIIAPSRVVSPITGPPQWPVLISGTFCPDASSKSFGHWGGLMAADKYRRLAAECLRIAEDVINSQSRNLLIHMSQSWLRLAHQYEQNLAPTSGSATVQQQQQQQIQPKKDE